MPLGARRPARYLTRSPGTSRAGSPRLTVQRLSFAAHPRQNLGGPLVLRGGRANWTGRQVHLDQKDDDPRPLPSKSGRMAAVAQVSRQAFVVAAAGQRRGGGRVAGQLGSDSNSPTDCFVGRPRELESDRNSPELGSRHRVSHCTFTEQTVPLTESPVPQA
jgi:hypothetical protein